MRRVLVTGAHGFLGRHVCAELESRNITAGGLRRSACDLTDTSATAKLFAVIQPTAVIHLAAKCGGIGANKANPASFFHDNLQMGLNVIEVAHAFDVGKLVVVGTVCSYPKHCPAPFREEDLWSGYPEETNAPYGIAKKALLVMLQAYREQYGLNGICLMPANLYGPGDNFDPETSHVIPALIRKFMAAKAADAPEVVVWGTGTPTREFLYVTDAARAIVDALEGYDSPEPMNIGTGQEISILDLADGIASEVGYKGRICFDPSKPDGQPRRVLDTTRAREAIGFAPRVSLWDGIRQTVEWWRKQRS